MENYFLEATYHRGRPMAAYLYLAGTLMAPVASTRIIAPGIVVDFLANGRASGVEFHSPSTLSLEAANAALGQIAVGPPTPEDLHPLIAA